MKTNIMQIASPQWTKGYVLGWHTSSSVATGQNQQGHTTFDTTRTEIGNAVFQLKYRSDFSQIAPLADEICTKICPLLGKISFVIPVPPSKLRHRQPVVELALAVSKQLERKFTDQVLVKTGGPLQIKDLTSKDAKMAHLAGRFVLNDFLNQGRWNVLVVDDLYSSGASLEAACATLRQSPKINEIFVAVASRTRGGAT